MATSKFMGSQQAHKIPQLAVSDSPGPGQYPVEGLGSMGSKVQDSRRPNAAAFSFGSGGRDTFAKTYVDKRTDRSGGRPNMTTSTVQFHNIDNMHSAGPQRSQIISKAPVFSFGKATRDQSAKAYIQGVSIHTRTRAIHGSLPFTLQQEHLKPNASTSGVSSTSYATHTDFHASQRHNSRVKNSPRFAFGSSRRPDAAKSSLTSSAQMTLPPNGLGAKSQDSRRPTTPAFSFGSGRRGDLGVSKAVTANIEFRTHGGGSIGAVDGLKGDSRKPRAPTFRFGSSRRPDPATSSITGGATMLDPNLATATSTGKMLDSRKQTLPSYGFGTSTRDHGARRVHKAHF